MYEMKIVSHTLDTRICSYIFAYYRLNYNNSGLVVIIYRHLKQL